MMRGHQLAACLALFLFVGFNPTVHGRQSAPPPPAPESASVSGVDNDTVFRVNVDMVQLNVAVIDRKGNYVTGLRPSDFEIIEDTIPQKMATFEEGNQGPIALLNTSQGPAASSSSSEGNSSSGPASAAGFSSAGA